MAYFENREEAGRMLAVKLGEYRDIDGVVFALPRGGVVSAVPISTSLGMPLDLLIPRKIGHPSYPEYAVCAVTEDGHLFCNEPEASAIDPEWLQAEIENQQAEARRRREKYLSGRDSLPIQGKTAIIVDDGIATGLTILAAIAQLKERKPARIVVAVPVIPPETADMLRENADELVAIDTPEHYQGSVGAYYENFGQVEDDEVMELLATLPAYDSEVQS